ALHAVRLRLHGLRLLLARLRDGLGPDDMLGPAQRQQIAKLGRVDHELGPEAGQAPVVEAHSDDFGDAIALGRCGDGFRTPVDGQPPRRHIRLEHLIDYADRYTRLEREARDPAVAGVRLAIVLADRIA